MSLTVPYPHKRAHILTDAPAQMCWSQKAENLIINFTPKHALVVVFQMYFYFQLWILDFLCCLWISEMNLIGVYWPYGAWSTFYYI